MSERRAGGGGAIFEAFGSGESTGIILQCYCTTGSVGGRLEAQSGIHPFMWKPRPRVSYQSDHPLQSDRDCQAAAGHSQPAAACTDAAAYCCWLHTKHPQLVQSLCPRVGGIFIHSVLTEIPQSMQEWLLNSSVEQPSGLAACALVLLNSGV